MIAFQKAAISILPASWCRVSIVQGQIDRVNRSKNWGSETHYHVAIADCSPPNQRADRKRTITLNSVQPQVLQVLIQATSLTRSRRNTTLEKSLF